MVPVTDDANQTAVRVYTDVRDQIWDRAWNLLYAWGSVHTEILEQVRDPVVRHGDDQVASHVEDRVYMQLRAAVIDYGQRGTRGS